MSGIPGGGPALTFDFPGGIWRVDGEAVRTGPAQVPFALPAVRRRE